MNEPDPKTESTVTDTPTTEEAKLATETTPETTPSDSNSAVAAATTSEVAVPTAVTNSHLKYAAGIIIAGALLAGAYLWHQNAEENRSPYPDIVAVVNGTEISNASFTQSVARTTELAIAQGALPSDPSVQAQIEEQALDVLVNTTLFLDAARAAGVSTTPAAVAEQYALIEEQFGGEAGLAAELADQNMTVADLNNDIEEQLIVDSYIRDAAGLNELAVSDEDIQAFYDTIPQGEGVPSLEELAPQIEQQIIANRQQDAVQNLIDMLRMNAVIEVNLED